MTQYLRNKLRQEHWRDWMMSGCDQRTRRSGDKLKCVDASAVRPSETFPLFETARRLGRSHQVRRTKNEKVVENEVMTQYLCTLSGGSDSIACFR